MISTARLSVFRRVHRPPINVVICHGPSFFNWMSHLEASFALRCFQRLSHRGMATQRCTGQYN